MVKMLTFKCLLLASIFMAGFQVVSAQSTPLILDDFESYTIANVSPQALWWTPWDLNDASTASAEVTSTFASNGSKSMKVKKDGASGDDQLLLLGNKSAGRYQLKWQMYIPAGNAAYFNVQTDQDNPGASNANYSGQIYFQTNGTFDCDLPQPTVSGVYPQDKWFELEILVDLDNNLIKIFIDQQLARAWVYTQSFGAIDFYSVNASYTFYIDEVSYSSLPPVTYNVDLCSGAIDLYKYFGAAAGVPKTTELYDNTNATANAGDPVVTCWQEDVNGTSDVINTSMWYTFRGDGSTYHIETVPCNASNYIGTQQDNPGDTQMLLFGGSDCTNLTELACNDNRAPIGNPDWRSAIDFQTQLGENYYLLIDGFEFLGVVATGEFCLEITKTFTISCADAVMGTYAVNNPFLCFEGQLADHVQVNHSSFMVPDEAPVAGFAWAFTSNPVPDGVWPSSIPGYKGRTPFLEAPYAPAYVNLETPGFEFGSYYLTPVILGGGTLIDPNKGKVFENIDYSNACFLTGASTLVHFLPPLSNISATASSGSNSVNLSPQGGLAAFWNDASVYTYQWSNGATTQNLSNVSTGLYSCTVSDISGCAGSAFVTALVATVGTKDPPEVQKFSVSPNPSSGRVSLRLELTSEAEVRVEVLDQLGRMLLTREMGWLIEHEESLDLVDLAQGTYFLRVTLNDETAVRRIVLER